MPRKPIPEHLLTKKQKKDKKYREQNKQYRAKYSAFYYLKKQLEDREYNKKRWIKRKSKKLQIKSHE